MDLFSFLMGLLVGGSVSMLGYIIDIIIVKKKLEKKGVKKEKKRLYKLK